MNPNTPKDNNPFGSWETVPPGEGLLQATVRPPPDALAAQVRASRPGNSAAPPERRAPPVSRPPVHREPEGVIGSTVVDREGRVVDASGNNTNALAAKASYLRGLADLFGDELGAEGLRTVIAYGTDRRFVSFAKGDVVVHAVVTRDFDLDNLDRLAGAR